MPSRIESFDGANDIEALSDHLATMSQIIDQARLEITGELEAASENLARVGRQAEGIRKRKPTVPAGGQARPTIEQIEASSGDGLRRVEAASAALDRLLDDMEGHVSAVGECRDWASDTIDEYAIANELLQAELATARDEGEALRERNEALAAFAERMLANLAAAVTRTERAMSGEEGELTPDAIAASRGLLERYSGELEGLRS